MLSITKLRKNKRNRSVSRYKQRGVVRRRARGPWCGRTGRKLSVQCTCTPPPPPLQCRPMHANSVQGPAPHQSPPHQAFSGQLDNLGPVQFVSAGSDTDPLPRRLCCALALAACLFSSSLHFTVHLHAAHKHVHVSAYVLKANTCTPPKYLETLLKM